MEKEENQNPTTKDHQEPEKETAKPEDNLDNKINHRRKYDKIFNTVFFNFLYFYFGG